MIKEIMNACNFTLVTYGPHAGKVKITAKPSAEGKRVYDEIAEESARGLTVEEIARKHGVSVKAIRAHLPYTRGAYNVEPRSANAQRIAERRARKREDAK